MEIMSLVILALVGEAVWETLKMTWQKQKINFDRIGALVVGLVLSFSTGLDILSLVGIEAKIPYIGVFLTGILISRGANVMHDIVASVGKIYQNIK